MNAISIGPLMLAADRVAVILGIFAFTTIAAVVARRVDHRIGSWSGWAPFYGVLAARTGHVIIHWDSFIGEPLRAFALWQGGFFWPLGLVAALSLIPIFLDGRRARLWSLAPMATGFLVWNTAHQLTAGVDPIPLPGTSFQTLAGNSLRFTPEADRPMVVNLWASWCPPCRREMPMMDEAADALLGVFFFANQGEEADWVRWFLAIENPALPLTVLDSLGELGRHYQAPGLPATLFIREDGTLADVYLGEMSRKVFQQKIARLKGADQGE